MVDTLYLIRHGRTEGDGEKRYKGSLDIPLAPEGEEEIRRTAEFVRADLEKAGHELAAVYCSALKRAKRSAEVLSSIVGPAPTVIEQLRERSFGQWEGMTFKEIMKKWPEEFRAWADDPLNNSPIDGETTTEVSERVDRALDEILERHEGGAIAVVAHGGVNRSILCRFMGLPLGKIFSIEQDHGAVSIIEFGEGHPVVRLLNYGGTK